MNYSIDWLKKKIENGSQFEFLFFWGHTPKAKDTIDKSCFSQWFSSPYIVDGTRYLTAEHWMMAKKAELFNDVEILEKILRSDEPSVVKKLGREIKNFDAETWAKVCLKIVVEGNLYKFSHNDEMKKFLLQTGAKIIVETSPHDAIWGIGLSQSDPDAVNPLNWKGTNLLGFALMEVRDRLKEK